MKNSRLKITTEKTYQGYELYSGEKATKGFYVDILNDLIEITETAIKTMQKPIAFHFTIDKPNVQKLQQLRQDLNRWWTLPSELNRPDRPQPLFLMKKEKKPRARFIHCHVYVWCEHVGYDGIRRLMHRLERHGFGESISLRQRGRQFIPETVDPATGEIRSTGSKWFHQLNKEHLDFIKRSSYIAKVHTSINEADQRMWVRSNSQNRAVVEHKKRNAENQTTQLMVRLTRFARRFEIRANPLQEKTIFLINT